MPIDYEWDVEELEVDDNAPRMDWDIIDHNHSKKLDTIGFTVEECTKRELALVLVRDVYTPNDGVQCRSWAYVVVDENNAMTLPEWFLDSHDNEIAKVPKRFHKELEKWFKSS